MREIVIASANLQASEHIRAILRGGQLFVSKILTSGKDVLAYLSDNTNALLICGRLNDMTASYLAEMLPQGIDIILLLPSGTPQLGFKSNLITLYMPLNRVEFVDTVRLLSLTGDADFSHKGRSDDNEELLTLAKKKLMDIYLISENDAYRILQRRSMETGIKIIELAKMIGNGSYDF